MVTKAVVEKIAKQVGGQAKLDLLLAEGAVEELTNLEGVGLATALRLVREAKNIAPLSVAHQDAHRIVEEIEEALLSRASTTAGRNRLRLRAPPRTEVEASSQVDEALAVARKFSALNPTEIRRALHQLKGIQEPNPRRHAGTAILVDDTKNVERLENFGLDRWYSIYGPRDQETASQHEVVIYLLEDGNLEFGDDANVIELPFAEWKHLPGPFEAWYNLNQQTLEALANLESLLGWDATVGELVATPWPRQPKPLSRRDIQEYLKSQTAALDKRIEAALSTLSLSALDVLRAQSKGILPASLAGVIQTEIRVSERDAEQHLGVPCNVFKATFPAELDSDELDELMKAVEGSGMLGTIEAQIKATKKAAKLKEIAAKQLARAWQFDAEFALARFCLDGDLGAFTWGKSFTLNQASHLALRLQKEDERVAYELGGQFRTALLTGANSGGKTTLLETVAQCAIMARMGLPIPAKNSTVAWMDEVHLVLPKKGLTAGAFETFLRNFLPLCEAGPRRLVLADEVEAITELEAASRIISFVVKRLSGSGHLSILVTHLAPQLMPLLPIDVIRIDGIEARGLDSKNQLIVDRAPRLNYLARSTPELILQRLANLEQNSLGVACKEILASLQTPSSMLTISAKP